MEDEILRTSQCKLIIKQNYAKIMLPNTYYFFKQKILFFTTKIHPQTGEVIPYPFRTSAFVLANTPISFALACLPPTVNIKYLSAKQDRCTMIKKVF